MLKKIRSDSLIPKSIKDFAVQALQNLVAAHETIIEACVFQMCAANQQYNAGLDIQKSTLVYLSTKNLMLSKEQARKLCPKWVSLDKVLEVFDKTFNYVWSFQKLFKHKGSIQSSMCWCCSPIELQTTPYFLIAIYQSHMTLVQQTTKSSLLMI